MKATGGSYSEWSVGQLARRIISLTLKDINISFNHLLYYLISRGDGRVVPISGELGNESLVGEGLVPLDGPARDEL